MSDKLDSVEKALSLTNDLRYNVTKVFQDLVAKPSLKNLGEAPAAVQVLKQNLGSVQTTLRSVHVCSRSKVLKTHNREIKRLIFIAQLSA